MSETKKVHEVVRYDFILEAMTPIAHASESIGNTSLVMREKRRLPDGSFAHVPIITGDTMRHGLREAGAYALLDAAGMLENPALGEAALRLLFAGGMISGSQEGSVKLSDYSVMIDLCPPLGLLGGCAQNRAIPGKVQVDAADLICDETAHRMPEWVNEWLKEHGVKLSSARGHVEEVMRVRMDPSLDPGKRKLLTDGGLSIERRLLASEHGKEVGDVVLADSSKSTMLPRNHETVVSGALFYWSVTATVHTELERDTFNTMVGAFLRDARVGGKRATGHGRIRPIIAKQIAVRRPREAPENLDVGSLAPKIGSLFFSHVSERKEKVAKFLSEVDA
jgi:hypothetical protein